MNALTWYHCPLQIAQDKHEWRFFTSTWCRFLKAHISSCLLFFSLPSAPPSHSGYINVLPAGLIHTHSGLHQTKVVSGITPKSKIRATYAVPWKISMGGASTISDPARGISGSWSTCTRGAEFYHLLVDSTCLHAFSWHSVIYLVVFPEDSPPFLPSPNGGVSTFTHGVDALVRFYRLMSWILWVFSLLLSGFHAPIGFIGMWAR